MSLENFYQKYPQQTTELSTGKLFTYRYYKNPKSKSTIVLLTGGIGLSDLFYLHFEKFAEKFSVLTFDYQIQFCSKLSGKYRGHGVIKYLFSRKEYERIRIYPSDEDDT